MNTESWGLELSPEEIRLKNLPSKVTRVPKIEKKMDIVTIAEGLLYIVGDDGLKLEQLAATLERSEEETLGILSVIRQRYDSPDHGMELVSYAGKYKFVSKREIYPYAQRLYHNFKPETLSQSALETLAIIAYKQPVTRIEIEELRGVGCEVMLRKLQARNLIKEAGRSEAPGRPILYEVTDEFLDSFELVSLEELPELPSYEEDEAKDLYE